MVQDATSVTNIEIGGLTVDTQYDQVYVTDANATISGTLNIALINGFTPNLGDTFTIINVPGRTRNGMYATVNASVTKPPLARRSGRQPAERRLQP